MLFDKDRFTIGELVGAILSIYEEDEARQFYEAYLRWQCGRQVRAVDERYTPEQIVKANIGWCFGEGMREREKLMWRRVCGAEHPIFGMTRPTPEEALAAGKAFVEANSLTRVDPNPDDPTR